MVGNRKILLNLIECLVLNGVQGILLAVYRTVLQGHIEFGHRHGNCRCLEFLHPCHQSGNIQHAEAEPFHIRRGLDGVLTVGKRSHCNRQIGQAHNIVAVTQLIQHHLTGFTLTGGIGAVAVTEEEGLIE